MNKQEIQTMIDSTIVPNKKKGITAESLRLVLKEMATAAPEGGSGDGALRVIVPEMMALGGMIVDTGELSPTSWETIRPIFVELGYDVSEYDAVVKAAFEHNANVAQQLIEKAKAGQGVSVVLDQTPYYPATFRMELQLIPEMADIYEECAMSVVQPAGLFMQYIDFTPEGEATMGSDEFGCVLAPAGNMNLDGMNATYPSNMLIVLNLDGSLLFEVIEQEATSSSDFVKRIWVDEALGLEPTEEHIAENKATYEFFKNGGDALVTLCYNLEGLERLSILCDNAEFFDDMFVSASASWDDNYYTHVSNTIGVSVQLDADGHIEYEFKRSGYLTAYLPKDGDELSNTHKDYNKEIYDIIKSGDVPSPIMIKALGEGVTYTSGRIWMEHSDDELGDVAYVLFTSGFTNVEHATIATASILAILEDGTSAWI